MGSFLEQNTQYTTIARAECLELYRLRACRCWMSQSSVVFDGRDKRWQPTALSMRAYIGGFRWVKYGFP